MYFIGASIILEECNKDSLTENFSENFKLSPCKYFLVSDFTEFEFLSFLVKNLNNFE